MSPTGLCRAVVEATGGGKSGSDSGGTKLGGEAMAFVVEGTGSACGGAGLVSLSSSMVGRFGEKEEATCVGAALGVCGVCGGFQGNQQIRDQGGGASGTVEG